MSADANLSLQAPAPADSAEASAYLDGVMETLKVLASAADAPSIERAGDDLISSWSGLAELPDSEQRFFRRGVVDMRAAGLSNLGLEALHRARRNAMDARDLILGALAPSPQDEELMESVGVSAPQAGSASPSARPAL
jgi:hypothetical protein